MTIADFLNVLRRNWILLVVALLIGAGAGGMYAARATPKYEAETTMLVSFEAGSTPSELQQGAAFTKLRMPTYVGLVTTPSVLNPVISELGLPLAVDKLAAMVTAKNPADTNLITIGVQSDSPQRAADTANAVGKSLGTAVQMLETKESTTKSPIALTTVRTAEPSSKGGTSLPFAILVGALLALILALAAAIIRSLLDTRVRSRSDIERISDVPLLGAIRASSVSGGSTADSSSAHSLALQLQFLRASRRSAFVMTSCTAREGAWAATASVARALAASGSSVVVVDADLRHPKLAQHFNLNATPGLAEVLEASVTLESAARRWGDRQIYLVPAGESTADVGALLAGARMAEILQELSSRFEYVLISAPALESSADAALLGALTDGAILVVSTSGATKRSALRSAFGMLQSTGIEVLGIVQVIGSSERSRSKTTGRARRSRATRPAEAR